MGEGNPSMKIPERSTYKPEQSGGTTNLTIEFPGFGRVSGLSGSAEDVQALAAMLSRVADTVGR